MRFVTFELDGRARPGVVTERDRITDLSGGYSSLLDLIEDSSNAAGNPEELVRKVQASDTLSLNGARLLAPIPRPRKLICVGLNYRDHAEETGSEIPKVPTIFNKFATSVIGQL